MNSTPVPDQSLPGPAAPPAFVPRLTRALAAANVLVFLLTAAAGGGLLQADGQRFIDWGTNFAPLTAAGEWWRLATAMFLHFGLVHLLFNVWALWVIGGLVERLYGHARFAVIYAVAGVAGGLASMAWNPLANSAGASGAIFGIIGAQLAFFMRGGHLIPAQVLRAQRNSTLAFIAYAVVFGLVVPGIDNAAHLGGLATGFGLGWMLTRPLGRVLSRDQLRRGLLGACPGLGAGARGRRGGGHLGGRAACGRAGLPAGLASRGARGTGRARRHGPGDVRRARRAVRAMPRSSPGSRRTASRSTAAPKRRLDGIGCRRTRRWQTARTKPWSSSAAGQGP